MAISPSSNDVQIAMGPAVNVADTTNELILRGKVAGDTFDRVQITAGGAIRTGTGAAAPAFSGGAAVAATSGTFGTAPGITVKDSSLAAGYSLIKAASDADDVYVAATDGSHLYLGFGHSTATLTTTGTVTVNSPAVAITSPAVSVGSVGAAISVYGVTPVAQAAAIATPTAPGATYNQTEMASLKTAIDALRVAVKNFGITL